MPADRPSVPVSTRLVVTWLEFSSAFSLLAICGAGALLVLILATMSGCCLTKSFIIPCVSCRFPAMSRMLSVTGCFGLSGTSPGLIVFVPPLPGAPHPATARAAAEIRPTAVVAPRRRRDTPLLLLRPSRRYCMSSLDLLMWCFGAAGAGGPYCHHSDLRLVARGGGAVDDRTISEVGSA